MPGVILRGASAALGVIVGIVRESRTQTSQPVTTSRREERDEKERREGGMRGEREDRKEREDRERDDSLCGHCGRVRLPMAVWINTGAPITRMACEIKP